MDGPQEHGMPLVSVVIPAYNRETYLAHAIDSVLAQTFTDFEVTVVDDGSKDRTPKIAQEYAQKDPRVRYIAQSQRQGAQAARNAGIRAARGQWIAFLDSDDQWLPDSLEVRLHAATTSKVQVVHSECYILRPDGALSKDEVKRERMGLRPLQGPIYKEVLRQPGPMFQGLLVTKEALTRIHYLDESIRSYQEWDTVIRLARCYPFAFVLQPTFIYDCRNTSSISRNLTGNALGYQQVFRKHQWSILRTLGPRALASHYEIAAYTFREAGDEARARRCLVWAVMWWPFRLSLLTRVRRLFRLAVTRNSGV
jgi:glycosyltransferase involved in cell wall biosynthesis